MQYQMTRPDRLYRPRTLLHRSGYDVSMTDGDPGGSPTLVLEVAVRPDGDPECVARIVHGCDPDARRVA